MSYFTPNGPIHITPGGDTRPHLAGRDADGRTWHIPYHGQTTLDMFERPTFDPRPQFDNIRDNNLGYLYGPGARRG